VVNMTVEEKKQLYSQTFHTEDDIKVLCDILQELGFWETYDVKSHKGEHSNPEVFQAKQYIARYILSHIGAWDNPLDVIQGIRLTPHRS
jgi:hypothetical protein